MLAFSDFEQASRASSGFCWTSSNWPSRTQAAAYFSYCSIALRKCFSASAIFFLCNASQPLWYSAWGFQGTCRSTRPMVAAGTEFRGGRKQAYSLVATVLPLASIVTFVLFKSRDDGPGFSIGGVQPTTGLCRACPQSTVPIKRGATTIANRRRGSLRRKADFFGLILHLPILNPHSRTRGVRLCALSQ